jgi:hypothetical protein
VVTFVLQADAELRGEPPPDAPELDLLELDDDQERVVRLFVQAGMVPRLRHRAS